MHLLQRRTAGTGKEYLNHATASPLFPAMGRVPLASVAWQTSMRVAVLPTQYERNCGSDREIVSHEHLPLSTETTATTLRVFGVAAHP